MSTPVFLKASSRPLERVAFAASLLVLGASVFMQFNFALMGDKVWLMLAAEEWLSGKKLYADIFEVNPPLILWIYAIPAWISLHVGALADYRALGVLGLLSVIYAIALCVRLIALHPAFAGDGKSQALFALLLASLFVFLTSPIFFFDREHIMLVFTFPYVLRFSPTLARIAIPLRLRIAIGLLAAVGFCIKPHAAFVFVALQLIYLLYESRLAVIISLENGIILISGALYLAAVASLLPDYFHDVLPMALATYSDFNVRGDAGYLTALALVSVSIPLLKFQPRYKTPYRPEIYYFMGVSAIYLAYAYLNNGWGYTYHPLFCGLSFLTVWLGFEFLWLKRERIRADLDYRHVTMGLRLCIASMAFNMISGLIVMASIFSVPSRDGSIDNANTAPFVKYVQENGIHSFGVMSAEFTRWAMISRQTQARWDTRFNHLWMVPALAKADGKRAASLKWVADYVGGAYAADLNSRKPDALFVDNSDEFFTYAGHIDLLALFAGAPGFEEALQRYRLASPIDFCEKETSAGLAGRVGCRYNVYRRADSP